MDERAREYLEALGLTEDQVAGWKVEIAQRAGKDVGLVITLGSEIHIAPFGPSAMSRKNTLQYLRPIWDEFGFVTTRVPLAETDHRLRTRLGFTETWADDQFRYFALTELPFERKTP